MSARFRPRLEVLDPRLLLASISGTIAIDLNGDHVRNANDVPVANGFVWADVNQNGRFDQDEPSDFSNADGEYLLENIAVGEVSVRLLPPVGLLQTYPYEHFAMQYDSAVDGYRLAEIDTVSGEVIPLGAAVGTNRNGLVKTVDGEFFASGHVFDSLYKIDAVTGEQTLIGDLGQEVVAGLAYDPVMNEIYTLARPNDEGDPVAALRLFKVDRTSATLIPVSDIEPSIDGIRFTTSLAFDWVNREVVLFDNGTDTAYAYDLHGGVRRMATFAPSDSFFNLAFDGFRFLTHRVVNGEGVLFEVDPNQGTLTRLTQLDAALNVNAGDRLAANEPHDLVVAAVGSQVAGVDFLMTKLALSSGQLNLSPERVQLRSQAQAIDTSASVGDIATELRFCVAGATNLDLQVAGSANQPYQVDLGDNEDIVSVAQTAFDAWPNLTIDLGAAHDVLTVNATEAFDLASLSSRLSGVDEIEVVGPTQTSLRVNENSILSISDAKSLILRLGVEDSVELGADEWFSNGIDRSTDQRLHALATDQVILSVRNGTMWHNPLNALDVNFDGFVSPIDALITVNLINQANGSQLDEAVPAFFEADYVDTNADNALSALDALLVVNQLNRG